MLGRMLASEEEDKTSIEDEFDDPGLSDMVGGRLAFSDSSSMEGVSKLGSATSDKLKPVAVDVYANYMYTSHYTSDSTSYKLLTSGSWSNMKSQVSSETPSPRRIAHRVTFEIVSAKTVTDAKKKYVSYTILVKRVPGLETQPGILERRYTDFLSLFQTLKKRYPSFLNDFSFPKKTIVGNFTADVITERSVAFQHLLAYAFSVRELRQSSELAEFLYNREIQEAHSMMKMGQFEDSSVILENIYFVQEKILDAGHYLTYYTLCVLVACLNAVDNVTEAQKYAEVALEYVSQHESSELTVPLLVLAVRLWWTVGKDKKCLERRLQEIKAAGINVDKQPTLLELVLHRECPLRPRS